MAEQHIISTLRAKHDDWERIIRDYEEKVEAARHDRMHVNFTLRLFELDGPHEIRPFGADVSRLFKRGKLAEFCKEALAKAPDGWDTRELVKAGSSPKGSM